MSARLPQATAYHPQFVDDSSLYGYIFKNGFDTFPKNTYSISHDTNRSLQRYEDKTPNHELSSNTPQEMTYPLTAAIRDNAGNTPQTARRVALESNSVSYEGWIDRWDKNDYYSFNLDEISNFNLGLSDLTGDADVQLLDKNGRKMATSTNPGTTDESINLTLDPGTYYVRVYPYQKSSTSYTLNLSATADSVFVNGTSSSPIPADTTALSDSSGIIQSAIALASPLAVSPTQGTLRADTFTYQSGFAVFIGNGNVDFGSGKRDVLDLSNINSKAVKLNLAKTKTGGVIYNPGNGNQVFDAIEFKDNSGEILFAGIDTIKFADKTIDLSVIPKDPLFSQQWNLHVMGVQNAWRFTTGSKDVLVGILDTGLTVDTTGKIHSDLRDPIIDGNNSNNYIDDQGGSHGTSTYGVIGATSNNSIGISGINWKSGLYMSDVMVGGNGDKDLATATQDIINLANSQGKRAVINLSLTGGGSKAFEDLVASNQDKALFVIAAGNNDTNGIASPANLAQSYQNVIAVGASGGTQDYYGNPKTPGERISYLDWWGSNFGLGLTLMGPSEFTSTEMSSEGYNNLFNGTSAAVPNVTGVASLAWSINQGITATQITDILSQTAYGLGPSGYDLEYGHGLVNADAAVRRVMAIDRGFA
jgi:serine protease